MARLFTTGFEFSSIVDNGLLSIGPQVSISAANARKSAGNNGGSLALDANTTSANLVTFQPFAYPMSRGYFRIYFKLNNLGNTHEYRFLDSGTGNELFRLRLSTLTGPFQARIGASTLATGTTNLLPNTFYKLSVYFELGDPGRITVDVDGFVDIDYIGKTDIVGSSLNQLAFNSNGYVTWDDIAVNSVYTKVTYSGNGVVPSGVLSDGTTTATIIQQVGDGTNGYMIIDRSGTAFVDGAGVTDSTTFTGLIVGNEDLSSTGPVPDGFVQLFFPSGNGTSSELTNSNETSDDNYSYVNTFENTTTFVYGESGGLKDTYAMQSIPAEALAVNHVDGFQYTKRDGASITKIRTAYVTGGNQHETHVMNIPGTYRWVGFPMNKNPETDAEWQISDLNDIEVGPKIEV